MAHKSASFAELRERNNEALEEAGYEPTLNLQELRTDQQRRIERLVTARVHLEDLASTENQREEYGIERWHEEFLRLREVTHDPHLRCTGEALRWHLWSRIPNCRFKRFQELFCAPENFIIPHFETMERGHITFPGVENFHTMSLAPCLVSPDRISEKLLKDLGLADFSEENGNPLGRLEKKRGLIARVKLLFEGATPLQKGHHRLHMVRRPIEQVQRRYEGIEGPPDTAIGTILYSRELENGRNHTSQMPTRYGQMGPRTLQVQHFDVYGALRKTYHESRVYEREILQLAEMIQSLQSMNGRLVGEWKEGTPAPQKAALRTEVQNLLRHCCETLRACENRHKVEAHEKLERIADLRDCNGRENVCAAMATMIGVITRLQRRFDDMYPKGGYNEQDRMVLQTKIGEHEVILKSFRARVEHFNLGGNSASLRAQELDRIELAPFRTFALRLQEKYEIFRQAIDGGNRDAAVDAQIQMHVIGKFQAACTCFEHIKRFVIDAERVPVQDVRNFVARLNEIFHGRQLHPDRIVSNYEQPFLRMDQSLQRIEASLARYANQDTNIDERTQLYGFLKDYLDAFDIEAMVRALP